MVVWNILLVLHLVLYTFSVFGFDMAAYAYCSLS